MKATRAAFRGVAGLTIRQRGAQIVGRHFGRSSLFKVDCESRPADRPPTPRPVSEVGSTVVEPHEIDLSVIDTIAVLPETGTTRCVAASPALDAIGRLTNGSIGRSRRADRNARFAVCPLCAPAVR